MQLFLQVCKMAVSNLGTELHGKVPQYLTEITELGGMDPDNVNT